MSKNSQSKGLDPEKIAQRLDEMARSMAYAIVFWDEGTEWLEFAPDAKRDVRAAKKAFRKLAGPKAKIEEFYSDNAPELIAAANDLEFLLV